ncbi:unannotated protein [freshwater metagenome]|uniref:Unannotated protein n=1 Tax=freshwater metagenome TaxID=449393 RepID=A0A6J5YMN5_9ZZZZ
MAIPASIAKYAIAEGIDDHNARAPITPKRICSRRSAVIPRTTAGATNAQAVVTASISPNPINSETMNAQPAYAMAAPANSAIVGSTIARRNPPTTRDAPNSHNASPTGPLWVN